jgi:hypothetical protein
MEMRADAYISLITISFIGKTSILTGQREKPNNISDTPGDLMFWRISTDKRLAG